MNTPIGLFGIVQRRRGRSGCAGDQLQRVVLADDALAQDACPAPARVSISSLTILPTGMPVQPEITSPTMLLVHADAASAALSPCNSGQLGVELLQLGARAASLGSGLRGRLGAVAGGRWRGRSRAGLDLGAQLADARHQAGFLLAARLQFRQARLDLGLSRGDLRQPLGVVRAECRLAVRTRSWTFRSSSSPRGVLDHRRASRPAPAPAARRRCRAG